MAVRQRTLPFPESRWEHAVDTQLSGIGVARERLMDELDAADPDLTTLGSEAEQLAVSCRSLLERWRHLEPGSPYRLGALPVAIAEVMAVIEASTGRDPAVAGALNLEPDLMALSAAQTKLELGESIREARGDDSLRSLSRRTGVSLGYLSELETGQKAPSDATCEKLDAALGTSLRDRVMAAQETERNLQARIEARRALQPAVPLNLITLGPRENARMQVIISALVGDPGLLALVERLIRLSEPAVTGIQKLVEELANDAQLRR